METLHLPVVPQSRLSPFIDMDKRPSLGANRFDLDLARFQLAAKPEKRVAAVMAPAELLPPKLSSAGSELTLQSVFPGLEGAMNDKRWAQTAVFAAGVVAVAYLAVVTSFGVGFTAGVFTAVYAYIGIYGSPIETPEPAYLPGCEGSL